jgi:hypothetical protein
MAVDHAARCEAREKLRLNSLRWKYRIFIRFMAIPSRIDRTSRIG